jgi:hypothetical protein
VPMSAERPLDAGSLGLQQLTCTFRIHPGIVRARSRQPVGSVAVASSSCADLVIRSASTAPTA